MRTISVSVARQNLSAMMIQAAEDRAPILITRQSGSPCVLMSLDEYNALQETTYLMSNHANAKHLVEAVDELRAGKGKQRVLIERSTKS